MIELAREFGTPAYVYAENDMRARARELRRGVPRPHRALRGHLRQQGVSLHRGLPAVRRGGAVGDVASGGELHLALAGGLRPERIYMHGNNKTEAELDYAVERGVGHDRRRLVRRDRAARAVAPGQKVMLRVTPGIKPTTHSYIQTGQVDSKFGFAIEDVPRAIEAARAGLELCGLHAHIGSQIFELEVYEKLAEVLARHGRLPAAQPRRRARHRLHRRGHAALGRRVRRGAAQAAPRRT